MRVLVIEPPAPVVPLQEAKDHLRVTHNAEDTLIEALVAAATGHIDGPNGWLGRAIGVQTLEATLPAGTIAENFSLPYPPLISIVGVTYRDAARQVVTVPSGRFEAVDGLVETNGDMAWSAALPAQSGVRVQYRAGYETVPAAIRAAILLMVGDLYRNRSTVVSGISATEVPMAVPVASLLAPFRVFGPC